MAKCTLCNSRKGKRKCMADGSFICTLCCGQSRNPEKCTGCAHFKDVSHNRNYRKVPFYGTEHMSESITLQSIGNTIESILCGFDIGAESAFTDKAALHLLEAAFDTYHFKEKELSANDPATKIRFEEMSQIIKQDLPDTAEEELIKVMAAVYRSIQRRTTGGREYLTFAQQFVAPRV